MIFEHSYREAARAVIGRRLLAGTKQAIILEAQGFSRSANESSLYLPLLSLQPGNVFMPRRRNAILILIACKDKEQLGGCILIRSIELNGREVIRGPGNASSALGLRIPKDPGRITEREDGILELYMERIGPPQSPPKEAKTRLIGETILGKVMPLIVKRYLQHKEDRPPFQSYLNQLLHECDNEPELRRRLRAA